MRSTACIEQGGALEGAVAGNLSREPLKTRHEGGEFPVENVRKR